MMMPISLRHQFGSGVRACLPTVLGYWSIGFAAGSIGILSGFNLSDVALLAGFLYAGSAQFLFYGMAAAHAAPVAIFSAVVLINIRYLLMSSAVSPYFYGQSFVSKFIGGALLTDETFGVAAQYAKQHGSLPFFWLLGLNITAYLNWVAANIAGAILARSLPESLTEGLSFSLTAMFIGLLLLTYFGSKHKIKECIAVIIAGATVFVTFAEIDANIAVLIATVAGATIATASSFTKAVRGLAWKTHS